jgi:DNA-binding MarR family transcriptional regulator
VTITKTRKNALSTIDRAMVRIRRSQSRRTIVRLMQRELGQRLNLAHIFVADALDEMCENSNEQPSVGKMAERLDIDPSRASRVVAGAIRAGFVKRIASQLDGRRAHLELTDNGRRALAATRRFRIMFFSKLMANWSDHDCAEFAKLLIRFTNPLPEMSTEIESSEPGGKRQSRRTATGKGKAGA